MNTRYAKSVNVQPVSGLQDNYLALGTLCSLYKLKNEKKIVYPFPQPHVEKHLKFKGKAWHTPNTKWFTLHAAKYTRIVIFFP